MDADGLPIVGPGIDYTKVGAIQQKRTLAFLNHFITHTVRFLNHFSCVCEEKLETLTVRLQRLETTMNLLEAKLSSIPGLENVTVASSSSAAATANETQSPAQPASQTQQQTSQNQPEPETQPDITEPEHAEPEQEAKPQNTVAQDPRYMKYFKLMQVGVPPMAFRGKMIAEGLNPDLLETPDASVPDANTQSNSKKDDSDTDFSDDDKQNDANDDDDDDSSGFSD